MNEYLFHRAGYCPAATIDPARLAGQVFYHQWKRRQHPFLEIEEGDRLWWVDKVTREFCWELRVVELLKRDYSSPGEALNLLRRCYGVVVDDLDRYYSSAPLEGWLLAFAVEVVQPVGGVELPPGEHLARNGIRSLGQDLRKRLEQAGLPQPGSGALTRPPESMNAGAVSSLFVPASSRYVPRKVREDVWFRDRGTCQECRRKLRRGEEHLDHYRPFSRGGPSSFDNLRVLCAVCNLSKGSTMPQGLDSMSFEEPVVALAAILERPTPRSVDDLVDLLEAAAATGRHDLVESCVLALLRDRSLTSAVLEPVAGAIDGLGDVGILSEMIRALLEEEDDQSIAILRRVIEEGSTAVREQALIQLADRSLLDDAELTAVVEELAQSNDRYVADAAAVLSRRLVSGRLEHLRLPSLIELLDSSFPDLRASAALELMLESADSINDGGPAEIDQHLEYLDIAVTHPSVGFAAMAALYGAEDLLRWGYTSHVEFFLGLAALGEDPERTARVAELRDQAGSMSGQR